MWSSLLWYLRKPLEFIGLLEEPEQELTDYEKGLLRNVHDFFKEETVVYKSRQGYVTQIDNNAIELAHKLIYELKKDTDNFRVGDYVKWEEYATGNGVAVKEGSVVRVDDQDKVETKIFFDRIFQIKGKCEYATHKGIIFYLDQVRCYSGYLPEVSDFVTLECTYRKADAEADDEEAFNPLPSDLRVVRVVPYGDKVVAGRITSWDPSTSTGVVNDKVVFHQDVCVQLSPSLGATVACNCVEGEFEEGYTLRAYNMTKNDGPAPNKRHFFVVEPVPEFEVVLGDTKTVELCVHNQSDSSACTVTSVDFLARNRKIEVKHGMKFPYLIVQGSKASWPVEIRGERIGGQELILKWTITGMHHPITSKIRYCTVEPSPGALNQPRRRAPLVIPGQRRVRNPMYRKVPMKDYPVSDELRKICSGNSRLDLIEVQIALNKEKPFLTERLSPQNYGEMMHTLLTLEEIAEEKRYEKLATRGALYRIRDYVTFNFDADSEYAKIVCGDKVLASKPWEAVKYEAIVCKISSTQLSLKFGAAFESMMPPAARFDLEFVMNRMPQLRRHQAVDLVLRNLGADWLFPCAHDPNNTDPTAEINIGRIDWFNKDLNFEQKTAVKNILAKKNLPYPYVIYGPPGTGKTVTVVESILQMIAHQHDYRILVTAPTNSAVDTLGLHLLQYGIFNKEEMVRLSSYNSYITGQIAAQLMDISMVPSLGDPAHDAPMSRDTENTPTLYLEDIRKFKIMIGTVATVSYLNSAGIGIGYFSHIIIDEAGQCHEPDTLLPIALAEPNKTQVVLAGDPQQLGPNISSVIAEQYGFDTSYLDRLTRTYLYRKKTEELRDSRGYNPVLITKLVMNYRSLPKIVHAVGALFYGGDLRPTISEGDSREARVLKKLVIREVPLKEQMDSMIFINVNTPDEQVEGNTSWMNLGEVTQVFLTLTSLYTAGVSPDGIGVITPYNLQKKKIYELLDNVGAYSPKVASVEEFQGQERDIIILSVVRNNLGISKRLPDFVTDPHRVNVALSRARVLNIIIGNKNTLNSCNLWAQIISRCRVLKAVSYPDPA